MSNISVKINLRQLKSAIRTMNGQSGDVECVVIPIAANNLVKGEKGIYLDLMGFELKERKPDRKDTHIVKQSFPKEVYDVMTDEEKQKSPILGNMIVWGWQEPAPVNVELAEPTDPTEGTDGDLPF
jgi:hypothetical protein